MPQDPNNDPREKFDLGNFLKDNGYKLDGIEDDGTPKVINPNGERGNFDVNQFLVENGKVPNNVNVQYNTPNNPIDRSPLGLIDRAALGLNLEEKRGVKFLNERFDRVAQTDQHGLVVQQDGAWYKVKPDLLGEGDAWQKTANLFHGLMAMSPLANAVGKVSDNDRLKAQQMMEGAAVDAVGTAPNVAASLAIRTPAMVAGSLLGPVGTVSGFVAGGLEAGAIAGKIKTSLGRALGTYDATPEEEKKDIMAESFLNLGGEIIGLGAQPVLAGVSRGLRTLGSWATSGVKSALTDVAAQVTRENPVIMREMLDNPTEVSQAAKAALNGAKTRQDAIAAAKKTSISKANELFDGAIKGFSTRYDELINDLMDKAGDSTNKVSVSMPSLVKDIFAGWEEAGVGKQEVKAVLGPDGEIQAMVRKFRPLTEKEKLNVPNALDLTPEVENTIKKMVGMFAEVRKLGNLDGEQAVQKLLSVRRRVNEIGREAMAAGADTPQGRLVTITKDKVTNVIGQRFEDIGLAEEYGKTAKLYADYGDAIARARQIRAKMDGDEAFAKKLVTDAGSNNNLKGDAELLAELAHNGEQIFQDIKTNQVAASFIPLFKLGRPWAPTSPALTNTLASLNSRFVGGAVSDVGSNIDIALARQGQDFIQKMTKPQLKQFLGNEDMVSQFLKSMSQASGTSQALVQGAQKVLKAGTKMPEVQITDEEQRARINALLADHPNPETQPDSPLKPTILGGRAYAVAPTRKRK